MADSKIEWTDKTWNPVTGCDRTSPGCDNCYALTMAKRLKSMGQEKYQRDGDPRTSGPGFGVTCHPSVLHEPFTWRKRSMVFVNSMSDLFHPDVPDDFIEKVFDVMLQTEHTYQVLTKRPKRMAHWVTKLLHPALLPTVLENIWLGTSIESDAYTFRADYLRQTPATVRFLSLEPLLGPLPSLNLEGIDWVIVGGESGRGAGIRPMHPGWVRDIRDRCEKAGVPFFFKQWGQYAPVLGHLETCKQTPLVIHGDGSTEAWMGGWHGAITEWGKPAVAGHGEPIIASVGKHEAGRELDGRTHDAMPELVSS